MKKRQEKEAKRNHVVDWDVRNYESDDEANPPTNGTRFSSSLLFYKALRRLYG
jgi:hypothetical protein